MKNWMQVVRPLRDPALQSYVDAPTGPPAPERQRTGLDKKKKHPKISDSVITHDGSMYYLDFPTWQWLVIYGVHVGKYTLRPIYPEVAGLPSRLPVRSRSTCEEHGLRLGYRPELGWIYPSQNTVTPPKFNIDPEKGWKRKKFPFRNWDAR